MMAAASGSMAGFVDDRLLFVYGLSTAPVTPVGGMTGPFPSEFCIHGLLFVGEIE